MSLFNDQQTPANLVTNPAREVPQIVRKNRKRLYGKAYQVTIGLLRHFQDNKCYYCHDASVECIAHKDNNNLNDDPSNLVGACNRCNARISNLARGQAKLRTVKEGESEEEIVDADDTSSIVLNQRNEPAYRSWVFRRTGDGEPPLYSHEAVYGGAESVGCSPQSAREYLKKIVSPTGPYDSVTVTVGKKLLKQIVPKAGFAYEQWLKVGGC